MPHQPLRLKPTLMLVLATACWALSFPVMKTLALAQQESLPGVSTWFIASLCLAFRFGAAALLMALWPASSLRQVTRSELWEGLGLGLFSSAGLILQMDGLAYTAASTSAFLTQCHCLFLPLWITLVQRRRPSLLVILSCVLVIAGVAVLSEMNWQTFRLGRGELETVLASVSFTGYILWLQRPKFAANDVNRFSLVMFIVIALCCLPVAVATMRRPGDLIAAFSTGPSLLLLGLLVFFSTLGGYLLMNRWQPHVSTIQAGVIYCAEPVFASLAAFILPAWFSALTGIAYANEQITTSLLTGGGLILAANLLIQIQPALPVLPTPRAEGRK